MPERKDALIEVLQLIEMLSDSYAGITKEYIRNRFNWGDRKIERTIDAIRRLFGDEILRRNKFDDGKVRYSIATPTKLSYLNRFNTTEQSALKQAVKFLNHDESLAEPLESLSRKIGLYLKHNERPRAIRNMEDLIMASGTACSPRPRIRCNIDLLEQLQTAILGYRQIRIEYTRRAGESLQAVVEPLGFLYGRTNNYLVTSKRKAQCKATRTYILDKIKSVEIMEQSFDPGDFDLQKYAYRSFGVYQESGKDGYDVRWRVSAAAADDAMRYVFHPTQKITKNDDGTLIVAFHADGLREMGWHLFTWSGEIVPLAPAELVDEYKKLLKKAADSLK